jgi:hypothetical protein
MDGRFARSLVVLMVLVVGPTAMTQRISLTRIKNLAASFIHESNGLGSHIHGFFSHPKPASACTETAAVLFPHKVRAPQHRSVCAAVADMHQTLQQRNIPRWHEADPLARPLVRLPAPAYYASGLVMATGLNWLSWKMAHSRRWHKLAPKLLAVGGNLNGFRSNIF